MNNKTFNRWEKPTHIPNNPYQSFNQLDASYSQLLSDKLSSQDLKRLKTDIKYPP